MIIEPYGERLIVKRLAESETRKSGLVLPDSVKERSLVGRVVHRGPDAVQVQEGDIIFFAKYSGVMLPTEEKYIDRDKYADCLIMNESDILGRLVGEIVADVQPIAKEVSIA